MVFSDASFASDLRDSKSTSGGIVTLVGPNTFVPITWVCKKQGAISHSSTEAEIIALDALLRMEGIPSLVLWENVIDTLYPQQKSTAQRAGGDPCSTPLNSIQQMLSTIDYVPPSLPPTTHF